MTSEIVETIKELREKIYQEGVEKGKTEAVEEFVEFCVNDWKMKNACFVASEPTDVFKIGGHLARLLEQFRDEYLEKIKE